MKLFVHSLVLFKERDDSFKCPHHSVFSFHIEIPFYGSHCQYPKLFEKLELSFTGGNSIKIMRHLLKLHKNILNYISTEL